MKESSGLVPRATSPAHHALGLSVSFGLHAVLLSLFLFWGHAEAEPERPIITPHTVVNTKLVALGKKRPKHLLPRLKRRKRVKKAPKHLGQEVRKHKDGKAPKKAPKEAESEEPDEPSVDDILSQFNENLPDDPRGDPDSPEGDPNGSPLGNATSGRLKSQYGDEIRARLEAYVAYSLLTEEELKKLRAQVTIEVVEVGGQGKIASFRFVKHSGNARFDESVTRALRLFGVDGPRLFPPFPEGSRFGEQFKAKITFQPSKR